MSQNPLMSQECGWGLMGLYHREHWIMRGMQPIARELLTGIQLSMTRWFEVEVISH